jgi:hypothetical protein
MPDDPEYEQAAAKLRRIGGFESLLDSGQQYYSAPELAEITQRLGLGGHRVTMIRWMQETGEAIEVEGIGWRIGKRAAVLMLASKIKAPGEGGAADSSAG